MDNTMLELVLDAADGKPALLFSDGKRTKIAKRINYDKKVFVPVDVDPYVVTAMTLPSEVISYGSTRDLFRKIESVCSKYCDLTSQASSLITYFAIATWFADVLPIAPSLVISTPAEGEARQLMRVLCCVCRHALTLAELTPAGFFGLPLHLQPTILMDQSRLTLPLVGLLRASGNRGVLVPRARHLFDLYCAKAIFFL